MNRDEMATKVREVIDEAIADIAWVTRDSDGHVTIAAGDIDTADIAAAAVDAVLQAFEPPF